MSECKNYRGISLEELERNQDRYSKRRGNWIKKEIKKVVEGNNLAIFIGDFNYPDIK